MNKNNIEKCILIIAVVGLIVGATAAVFEQLFGYIIFAIGALFAIAHAFIVAINHKTSDVREARLQRLYFISTLFLGAAAWFMFKENNAWVVMILIYAVTAIFLSFRGKKND